MDLKLDFEKVSKEVMKKLKSTAKVEVTSGSDDIPMVLNILKLLELYETGNFYGTISIKIVGVSPRNLRIQDQSFRLSEEKEQFFLDNKE